MRILNTATDLATLSGKTEKLWAYNGLDCCITIEVFETIEPKLDNATAGTYAFSRDLMAPVLEMNMRGVLIDQPTKDRLIDDYTSDIGRLERQLYRLVRDGVGYPLTNWQSNQQLLQLFYTALRIPPIKKRNTKGLYTPTVNRDALEKLGDYFHAKPIVNHLLKLRDLGKKVSTLKTSIDPDSRLRTSFNIAGTETGRFASSFSDFGSGTNLQNIEPRLRRIFVADQGFKFANIDLSQADARNVGAIIYNKFSDSKYLDACESGDLHTMVCSLAWSELPWTDDPKRNREIADQIAYRNYSYRDLAKRLGHGTNYMGMPVTMAKHAKVERQLIEDFQRRYFNAFPFIRHWHASVQAELIGRGQLTTLLGRKRLFFGRRNDDATLRAAVAYEPQSLTADIINRGLLNVWRSGCAQVLLQVHDSILVQYPEDREAEIVPELIRLLEVPIELKKGRVFTIPAEAKIGWNWADSNDNNPDGLSKWKGADERRRIETPKTSILDRRFL